MSNGVNKVILIGCLGHNPEQKSLPNGEAVTNIQVATSDSWKDKNTGEKRELTEWHKIVFFGRLAEFAGMYCKKGSRVYIEGSIRSRSYVDKHNQKRVITEIKGSNIQLLDSKNDAQHLAADQYLDSNNSASKSRSSASNSRQNSPQKSVRRTNQNGTLKSPYTSDSKGPDQSLDNNNGSIDQTLDSNNSTLKQAQKRPQKRVKNAVLKSASDQNLSEKNAALTDKSISLNQDAYRIDFDDDIPF